MPQSSSESETSRPKRKRAPHALHNLGNPGRLRSRSEDSSSSLSSVSSRPRFNTKDKSRQQPQQTVTKKRFPENSGAPPPESNLADATAASSETGRYQHHGGESEIL